MRLIMLLILFSYHANATIYYVDFTGGSDSNNGTSTGTPWKTIAKVNATSFSPDDQILFKKGESWNERLNVSSSGTSGHPIIYSSYGSGVKPVITGFQTLSGLTNVGNVWTATATNSVKKQNMVLVNGVPQKKGRYPNYGFLTYTSHSGKNQITGGLTGTPDYTGGEAVVRVYHWIYDVCNITSQSSGTLNLWPDLTYEPFNNYGYFIQNLPSVLDTAGEWCYDSATKVFKVYSETLPTVQISTIDTLVHFSSKDYVTLDGLSFSGANKSAVKVDTSRHITIQNCVINYSGWLGISGGKSAYLTILNDSFYHCQSGAIFFRRNDPYTPTEDSCNNALISGNYVKNIAIWGGMGINDNGTYQGINIVGSNNIIRNNRVDSVGFSGVVFQGQECLIYQNFITNICLIKNEGAGINTGIGSYFPPEFDNGSVIRSNIIMHTTEASIEGTPDTYEIAAGIYLDDATDYVTVDSNTVYDCMSAGMFFNDARRTIITNNLVIDSIGVPFVNSDVGSNILQMSGNVMYSYSTTQPAFYITSIPASSFMALGGIVPDSNVYLRPVLDTGVIRWRTEYFTIPQWYDYVGFDQHSTGTPTNVTSAAPLFYFNETLSDKAILLNGTYKDAKGVIHVNSITLKPFTSTLLFKTIDDKCVSRIGNFNFL